MLGLSIFRHKITAMKILHRPTMISAFCAVFVAMNTTLSAAMADAAKPLPGFLEMARDAEATPARKITIAAMLDFAKEDDPELAFKKLKKGLPLCTLNLADNGISDLSDLLNLNQKTTCFISLDLADNSIVDVEPIGQLESVVSINLSGNKISDISPLKNSELGDLDLKNNKVADFSRLREMDSLGRVDVSGNPIKDFSELLALKSEKTELEIVGGEPFEEAYRKSVPVKEEFANSPLLGIWRTEVQESEWGDVIIEMRFEANGIYYQTIRPGDPEEEGELSMDGFFSTEGKILTQKIRGDESEFEFKVGGGVLTLTHEGESKVLKRVVK